MDFPLRLILLFIVVVVVVVQCFTIIIAFYCFVMVYLVYSIVNITVSVIYAMSMAWTFENLMKLEIYEVGN